MEMDTLDLDTRLQEIGLGKLRYDNRGDLLKILLKQLLGDKTIISVKLDLLIFIEEEIQDLVADDDFQSIKLVTTAFRSLLKAPMNEANAAVLGQCLMSSTALLLTTLHRGRQQEVGQMLVGHLEALLTLVCQANNSKNVQLRVVAANCMTEAELCFPGLLKECLDLVYTATAFETSIAHQQYLELLTVLMCNSQQDFVLDSDIPQFHVPASLSCDGVGSPTTSRLPASELEQLTAFALAQLPLLSTAASVRVAGRTAGLLHALSDTPLSLASVHLLQPVLQQYLNSYCLTACQLVIELEKQFGSSDHLKDDAYRQKLLDHLVHGATLPSLPVASRLIFLSWLHEFLSRHPEKASQLSCQQLLQPRYSDGTHTQLKKIQLMTLLLKGAEGCSHSDLLKSLDNMCQQIYSQPTSTKLKAAFIKILYYVLKSVKDDSALKTHIQSLLVEVSVRDAAFSPFLLDLLRAVADPGLEGSLLGDLLPRLLLERSKPDLQRLASTLDIMMHAISSLDIGMAQPKEMLAYVAKSLRAVNVKINAVTGHHVLSLCHKIMKLFDAREFLIEMEQVLEFLTTNCNEEDVQNRAQSYITLLACLSDLKVKEVLKAQKKTISQLMVTEGMFHKAGTLQVLDEPLLRLSIKGNKGHSERVANDLETLPELPGDALQIYQQHIENKAGSQVITIPCTVAFAFPVTDNVQAVAIFLTPCNPVGKIEPVFVGNMSQKLASKKNSEFLDTQIKYFPKQPYPLLAHARSEFSMGGKFCTAPLEPFKIELNNLFQPLQVPVDYFESSKQWRKGIFALLWDVMGALNDTTYYKAMTVVNRPISQVRSKIKHELKHYVVQKGAHEAEIGIYIAPGCHILLKMQQGEESSTVHIRTNNIFLMAHINDYFSHW